VRFASLSRVLTALLLLLAPTAALARGDELVNVALARWGAHASADGEFSPSHSAARAIDGQWSLRDEHKWASSHGTAPHWLVIDLGTEREVEEVAIRHEGVFEMGDVYNTGAFQLQRGETAEGPWTDLVEPVRGNRESITRHSFAPTPLRWFRLYITEAEQGGSNTCARIYEVELYARRSSLTPPLTVLTASDPVRYRTRNGALERLVRVECLGRRAQPALELRCGKRVLGSLTPDSDVWVPAATGDTVEELSLRAPDGTVLWRGPQPSLGWFSPLRGGLLHIAPSSHQDIAWMDSPEACIAQRDREVITPALARLAADPTYCFTLEDGLMLREYLERHPDRREEMARYCREERLEIGATYNQPYESLYASEALVRQLYVGKRWVRQTLDGADSRIAWSVDVPGRAMQMPQILRKAGVEYLVISRHKPGPFAWLSPDGSAVSAWSPGIYPASAVPLQGGLAQVESQLTRELAPWSTYYAEHGLAHEFLCISSSDSSGPADYSGLLSGWSRAHAGDLATAGMAPGPTGAEAKPLLEDAARHGQPGIDLPRLEYSTATRWFDALTKGKPRLEAVSGERPGVWLYIHGPTHYEAIKAGREAWRLLPAAETFATWDALLTGSFAGYPKAELDEAWASAIYPDHGWGGNQGEITDALFRAMYESARDTGQRLLDRALGRIAGRVAAHEGLGKPLVVANTLSWARGGPVAVDCPNPSGTIVRDATGRELPSQVVTESGRQRLLFLADEVPSLGYRTYYLATGERPETVTDLPARPVTEYENGHFRLTLAPGGVRSLIDKTLGREVLDTGKFLGAELFTMQSVGNGAGEFDRVQQPSMEGFDKLSSYPAQWFVLESGPVRTTLQLEQKTEHCTVRERLHLWEGIRRIDCEVDLLGWDGTHYREWRLAFPLAEGAARVSYDVPMGVVTVGESEIRGAAGWMYTQPCTEVRPREVQDWIDASGAWGGLTLASGVAVCDYVDPTHNPEPGAVLQPILLASRKSCHPLGNWYSQEGDHSYRFALLPHAGGWEQSRREASEFQAPLRAVAVEGRPDGVALPESLSLCSVDADNVVVSAVKRSEEDDSLVVRAYEVTGRDTTAQLTWAFPVAGARGVSIIEDDLRGARPLPVLGRTMRLALGHHAIETARVWVEPAR
jgi:alpha-mannosidase